MASLTSTLFKKKDKAPSAGDGGHDEGWLHKSGESGREAEGGARCAARRCREVVLPRSLVAVAETMRLSEPTRHLLFHGAKR